MFREIEKYCQQEHRDCAEKYTKGEEELEEQQEEVISEDDNMLEMTKSKENYDDASESERMMHLKNEIDNNFKSIRLTQALEPFDVLRCSYDGSHDSIKCIDVDVEAQRIYAASWSEGVLVWDLYSHKPIALLRHSSWVNTLKCFYTLPLSQCKEQKEQSVQKKREQCAYEAREVKALYVLTGCEDGVLTAWDADTFSVHARVKLSLNPISIIYIEEETCNREINSNAQLSAQNATSSPAVFNTKCNEDGDNDDERVINNNSPIRASGRAYIAAMHHIFVIWVGDSLTLIHDLVHPSECLCVTSLVSSVVTYLIVGQDNGQLICWNTSNWDYADTLEYPGDESDVSRDCLQGNRIHEPKLSIMTGQLEEEIFQYNIQRYNLYVNINNTNRQNAPLQESRTSKGHLITISGQAPFSYGAERNEEKLTNDIDGDNDLSESDKRMNVLTSTTGDCNSLQETREHVSHLAKWVNNLVYTKENVSYDDRRVTCLSSSDTVIKSTFCNLYSGHANGVLLIWQSPFPNMPMVLMKKLHLFPSNAWVRSLTVIPIITYAEAVIHQKAIASKGTTSESYTPIATKETQTSTKTKQKVKKYKTNGSNAATSNKPNAPVETSKAERSTQKYAKNEKKRVNGQSIHGKTVKESGKHSTRETKESEYLFVCSDQGAIKYLKVDSDNVSSVDGPGILADSACCWTDCKELHEVSEGADVKTKKVDLPTHVYVAMGSYDGRVERYDITAVIDRLHRLC